ncbi:uncharacterized protein MONOS_4317 [Monocercomonoides exilis]|uniref:uncharacterized protein n=1 Tax=Monocercomonoides exilis TaxID=2049356 RepID=UPI00355A77D3|nr:hypothetical protein MONOS_4317 [Monocercomonoides exilis]|eukprot:MONOS_4317.1-p1 / transcript=MONOS_4317.1 / gene=MONOS_4317 / organism=Monocercomonoides_exilis_PA203 / gene_product=unspecified product / transcript_product=unspecified product / location=Mono_scaffold00113:83428-84984(-) / protein_length=458 / sequence_SO=supercontig / SO=protein_coding / is_pseudo=false
MEQEKKNKILTAEALLSEKQLGLFSNLTKSSLTAILGFCSPRTLGALLRTTKAFKQYISNDDVYALQVQRLKRKALAERENMKDGSTFDMWESYDEKYLGDDRITSRREGDVMEGFFVGEIENAKPKTKRDEFEYELQERGRRCIYCKERSVHAAKGTVITLESGKQKYAHRACTQPFIQEQLSRIFGKNLFEKPFVILGSLRGYESVASPDKYGIRANSEAASTSEPKSEEAEEDFDDWEAEMEQVEKDAEKKNEEEEMKKKNEELMNKEFDELKKVLKEAPIVFRCDSSASKDRNSVVSLQMRKKFSSRRPAASASPTPARLSGDIESVCSSDDDAESPEVTGVKTLPQLIDESLRAIGNDIALWLSAPLCTVSGFRGEKRYTVKEGKEKEAKEIIAKVEELWNTSGLMKRSLEFLSSSSASSSSSSSVPSSKQVDHSLLIPYKHHGQPIFPKTD